MTGSYHNGFHVYDRMGKTDLSLEASKNVQKKPPSKKVRASLWWLLLLLLLFSPRCT